MFEFIRLGLFHHVIDLPANYVVLGDALITTDL